MTLEKYLEYAWNFLFLKKKKAYNGSIVCDNIRDYYKDYNIKSICIFNLYDCMNSRVPVIVPIIKCKHFLLVIFPLKARRGTLSC